MAETAHHQRDRALLRRSAQTNPAHGVLCQRRKRGSYHLLHLPEIQPGMEIPHPQPIYTSSLTSPEGHPSLTLLFPTRRIPAKQGGTMRSKLFLILGLLLTMAAAASGQTKTTGTLSCGKPD